MTCFSLNFTGYNDGLVTTTDYLNWFGSEIFDIEGPSRVEPVCWFADDGTALPGYELCPGIGGGCVR